MDKNFLDFRATLDSDTLTNIFAKYKNPDNTISTTLENSVLMNLDLLELYHNWMNSNE